MPRMASGGACGTSSQMLLTVLYEKTEPVTDASDETSSSCSGLRSGEDGSTVRPRSDIGLVLIFSGSGKKAICIISGGSRLLLPTVPDTTAGSSTKSLGPLAVASAAGGRGRSSMPAKAAAAALGPRGSCHLGVRLKLFLCACRAGESRGEAGGELGAKGGDDGGECGGIVGISFGEIGGGPPLWIVGEGGGSILREKIMMKKRCWWMVVKVCRLSFASGLLQRRDGPLRLATPTEKRYELQRTPAYESFENLHDGDAKGSEVFIQQQTAIHKHARKSRSEDCFTL